MTLRARLFLLVGGVAAVTVAGATWIVSASARRAFAALDAQRSSVLVAQFRREFDRQGEDVAERVASVAASDDIERAAAVLAQSHADASRYVDMAAPLASARGLDVLDLLTADGAIVSSASWPARFGYRITWPRSEPVGRPFLQAIEQPRDHALAILAVAAVPARDPTLLVVGGRRLDEHFLQSLALPPGLRAQFVDATGGTPPPGPLESLIARARQTGVEATETIEWPDGPESVNAIPLTGSNGSVLGVLIVGASGSELAALLSRIRWTGIAVAGVAILAAFGLSYLAAARVTRPVEELARGARAVAAGDWDFHVPEDAATGEIDDLARAFETMTRQLVDQRERLVQAERVAAWRELARRLSHELKNPLFPLRLTVDNLHRAKALSSAEFDEVFEESLGTLSIGLSNLTTVVGRFSDFARMPAPRLEAVGANDLVQQAVQLYRAQMEAPGRQPIAAVLELDPSAPVVRVDPEQFGRALQNLVLNAIDAMPSGGRLTARTVRMPTAIRFEIADTGEGLTEEESTRLFTPYYTTKAHGTGLGLAIVQSVVSDHGGRISVKSARGRGATFIIDVPAVASQSA